MNERKAEERGKLLDSVLREHRIQNGELGKTMNVHNTTISRYRRGTSDISEERWAQISTMLYAHWGIKMWEQKITEPTLSPTKTPANGNFKTMREHFGTKTHTLDTYDLSNPEDRAYLLMRIEQLERIKND